MRKKMKNPKYHNIEILLVVFAYILAALRRFLSLARPFLLFETCLVVCMLPVIVAIGLLKMDIFDGCRVVSAYIASGVCKFFLFP